MILVMQFWQIQILQESNVSKGGTGMIVLYCIHLSK